MGFSEHTDIILNCSLQQLTSPWLCMGFPECINTILNCTLQQQMLPWVRTDFPECTDIILNCTLQRRTLPWAPSSQDSGSMAVGDRLTFQSLLLLLQPLQRVYHKLKALLRLRPRTFILLLLRQPLLQLLLGVLVFLEERNIKEVQDIPGCQPPGVSCKRLCSGQ